MQWKALRLLFNNIWSQGSTELKGLIFRRIRDTKTSYRALKWTCPVIYIHFKPLNDWCMDALRDPRRFWQLDRPHIKLYTSKALVTQKVSHLPSTEAGPTKVERDRKHTSGSWSEGDMRAQSRNWCNDLSASYGKRLHRGVTGYQALTWAIWVTSAIWWDSRIEPILIYEVVFRENCWLPTGQLSELNAIVSQGWSLPFLLRIYCPPSFWSDVMFSRSVPLIRQSIIKSALFLWAPLPRNLNYSFLQHGMLRLLGNTIAIHLKPYYIEFGGVAHCRRVVRVSFLATRIEPVLWRLLNCLLWSSELCLHL